MVNSQFTARTFKQTFTTLNVVPEVLYPSLDFSSFDIDHSSVKIDQLVPKAPQHVFLSINRYERKKNLNLALEALVELRSLLKKDFDSVHLVMAGGYDTRVAENVEHYEELSKFAKENKLLNHVTFLKSFSDAEKVALIARCECLVYTPSNEHFGITPLEAMYCNRPVIAVNSGGPLETIADASSSDPQTGFLCAPQPKPFALAMQSLCETPANVVKFGKNGRDRVITKFGFTAFQTQLSKAVEKMAK